MRTLVVTVVGDDRPGIVAAVTRALADAGCNLEDTSMSDLRGHFSMMLVVRAPEAPEPSVTVPDSKSGAGDAGGAGVGWGEDAVVEGDVEGALAVVARDLGLWTTVREVTERRPVADEARRFTLTLHGADRPGIVSAVSGLVAGHGGSVSDLVTRLAGGLYVLTLELALPAASDPEVLRADLAEVAARLDVEARLAEADGDLL